MLRPLPWKEKGDRPISRRRPRGEEALWVAAFQDKQGLFVIAADRHPSVCEMSPSDLEGIG
ncbi:MAG: hypothetical protein LC672_02395, partial [Acidobacteria bacterium]|nr:hypothetical protein [Acidobacteriota bacterium]